MIVEPNVGVARVESENAREDESGTDPTGRCFLERCGVDHHRLNGTGLDVQFRRIFMGLFCGKARCDTASGDTVDADRGV